jgi:dihydroorotate dehydrogenase electron transfer subunit
MPFLSECTVTANLEVARGHYRLALRAPDIARAAAPGQFAMLEVSKGYYPFLRRPFSFERIFPDGVTILFKVEGEGTRMLSRMTPDQTVSVQGPLGNGFTVDPACTRHILVAGGIGVAPFPALAEKIARATGKAPEVIIGARTRELLLLEHDFRQMRCGVSLATDDGSYGTKGYVTELLERLDPRPPACVYACGPMIMMRGVAAICAERGVPCQVSLEAQMACGDGACLGCVVESVRETEGEKMVRVCKDGPVFDARIIRWEAHRMAYDV